MIEHSELEQFLSNAAKVSAVNGANIVSSEGSLATGATTDIAQGTNLSGYRNLAITVKNRSGSANAITCTFLESNSSRSTRIALASLRVSPGNTGYVYVSTALAGPGATLTVAVTADPANPSGEDSFQITITGYTS